MIETILVLFIEFQVVETLNNRFVSSDTALEDRRILVTINPTSDTPDLSVANVSGVEDDAFIPFLYLGLQQDQSETVTVYVEKPSQVVKFINTTTNHRLELLLHLILVRVCKCSCINKCRVN